MSAQRVEAGLDAEQLANLSADIADAFASLTAVVLGPVTDTAKAFAGFVRGPLAPPRKRPKRIAKKLAKRQGYMRTRSPLHTLANRQEAGQAPGLHADTEPAAHAAAWPGGRTMRALGSPSPVTVYSWDGCHDSIAGDSWAPDPPSRADAGVAGLFPLGPALYWALRGVEWWA
jgi:hypothetical protein